MSLDSKILIEKRPDEKLLVGFDFGPWLIPEESIVSIDSVDAVGDEGSITITSLTISGSRIVFYIEDGTAGIRYTVKAQITTSTSQILIGEGPLRVIK